MVWNMNFYDFPYIGKNNPNWLIYFRGAETTNQIIIYIYMYCIVLQKHYMKNQS